MNFVALAGIGASVGSVRLRGRVTFSMSRISHAERLRRNLARLVNVEVFGKSGEPVAPRPNPENYVKLNLVVNIKV